MLLPENFRYLGRDGEPCSVEISLFRKCRAFFGISEDSHRRTLHELLFKVSHHGQKSTAKSGSLMAFHGGLVAKSMSEEEVDCLLDILESLVEHLQDPVNDSRKRGGTISSLLPRVYGAFTYNRPWALSWFSTRQNFLIMANAFDGVPAADMKNLDIFDLKGSLDNRHQRTAGGVLMGFDLLMADRKLVPASADEGKELLAQVERDTAMLVKQKMSFDPYGFDEDMHSPGLMDYSLLVGVAPLGTPGGLISLKMRDERTVYHNDVEHGWKSGWQVESTDVVVSVGIIDILQFWNTKKRIARYMKKLVGKERDDDGKYKGGMLDSVQPEVYQQRFIRFVDQVFASGSWLESLPKMYENNWGYVPLRQIHQLPDPQRSKAEMQHTAAYRTLKWSARTHPASGCNIPETIASCFCCGRKLSGEDEKEQHLQKQILHHIDDI